MSMAHSNAPTSMHLLVLPLSSVETAVQLGVSHHMTWFKRLLWQTVRNDHHEAVPKAGLHTTMQLVSIRWQHLACPHKPSITQCHVSVKLIWQARVHMFGG
eukprot:scpid106211/ scgid7714/ 